MPTYEYECTRCGAVTEVFQPITQSARRKLKERDRPACDCNAAVTRRIGSGAGVIFKGSGFYQTDYRSEAYKKAAKAEKEAAGGKSKKDDAKTSKETTDAPKSKSTREKKPRSTTGNS